ncbi:uncharacterized protein [Palaemon carinicauda]|uniref:uncharacterized protein isoform X1 n=1 Tax=Palaemon carinicauda TaxID=392227 RepID=UPI0035B5BDD3
MNTKVKPLWIVLLVSSLSQGITSLPATPQSQQFPSKRLDETQNPLAYEKDFDREQKKSQDELPEQNVETDYRQRNENQQIPLMREGEIDGTGPGEVINQKNRQGNIDLAKQIHSLTIQSNQQQGNGLIESDQINQGRLPKDWGQSEEIIDGYIEDTSLVKSQDAIENSNFQQENENLDLQRSDASEITNRNSWLKWDRSNGVKDKKMKTSSRNTDGDKWILDREETNKANDLSEVVEVQERGLQKWLLKSKSSRKGKTKPATKNRRNKFWKKFNRKGNGVVRQRPLSPIHDRRKSAKYKKVFKKSQNKFDRAQNESEKTVQEYGNDNGNTDPESKDSQLDDWKKWDRGATGSRKTDDLDDVPAIEDILDNEGRAGGKMEHNPTESNSLRDDWKKWDRGAINSGKREEVPDIQDINEETSKKWDEENPDGDVKNSPTDDDSPRDDWRKWDKGAINSGKREEIPDIQDNDEEAWKKWDEEITDGNMEISPADDDSPRDGWKKWNRGAINSGKREEIPDIQGSNKEAWKKLDEEETNGNIENSPTDDDSPRDDWTKWDRGAINYGPN